MQEQYNKIHAAFTSNILLILIFVFVNPFIGLGLILGGACSFLYYVSKTTEE